LIVEELQGRLVVRVGRADADRGVQAGRADQAGQVLPEQRAAGDVEDRRAGQAEQAGTGEARWARTRGGRSAL
jgi:hypothetical protein